MKSKPPLIWTEKEWEKVELFFRAGVSVERVAKAYALTPKDFKEKLSGRYGSRFGAEVEGMAEMGKLLIEACQFQKAISGNIPMLTHLGKVRCGQRDDMIGVMPANQDNLNKEHSHMMMAFEIESLQQRLHEMQEKLDFYQPKTE